MSNSIFSQNQWDQWGEKYGFDQEMPDLFGKDTGRRGKPSDLTVLSLGLQIIQN